MRLHFLSEQISNSETCNYIIAYLSEATYWCVANTNISTIALQKGHVSIWCHDFSLLAKEERKTTNLSQFTKQLAALLLEILLKLEANPLDNLLHTY